MEVALLWMNLLLLLNWLSQVCKSQLMSCTPSHSQPLFEVNATDESTMLLLVEGRCYLSCLNRYPTWIMNVSLYPVWPYAVLKAGVTCEDQIAQIHECTRGCRTRFMENLSQSESSILNCRDSCIAECTTECGGAENCENLDSIDQWVARSGCPIFCNSRTACILGCIDADRITPKNTTYAPVPPVSTPTLVELNDSSIPSDTGLYSINLTKAEGDSNSGIERHYWNGFLFRIHDLASNNITYIWQHDPREYLNLSSHICREVEVSFSVVNQFGSTNFSEAIRLNISGDIRQLPNAPFIHPVEESLDRRKGFFQHVIINVTWESPQVDSYLTHFEVTLRSAFSIPGYCQTTNMTVISKVTEHISNREYSTLLKAETAREDPIMGCNYTIMVSSVGPNGSRSVSELYTTKSLKDYMAEIMMFTSCNNELARSSEIPFFNFYFELIILTSNLAEGNYISDFEIARDIVDDNGDQTQGTPGPPLTYDFMPNKTQYVFEYRGYSRFQRPRTISNDNFRFRLSINWNMDQLLVTPTLDPYSCTTSALSPRPSDVRKFTVWNGTVVNMWTASFHATWLPPLQPNGILSNYTICISRLRPLSDLEEPGPNSQCEEIDSNLTSVDTRMRFNIFPGDNFIYLQIRPKNTYIEGNWSEFYNFSLDTLAMTTFAPSRGLSDEEITATTITVVILVLTASSLCFLCLICYVRRLRKRKRLIKLTETAPNFMPMFGLSYSTKINSQVLEIDLQNKLSDEWEVLPSDVIVDELLGQGAFGEVYRGYLKGPLANGKVKTEFRNALHLPVAIKLLKDSARGSDRKDFLSEIEMMKKVSEGQNPHVVAMLGCVTTQEPLCLFIEFVQYGDLLSYLRSSRQLYLTGSASKKEDPYQELGQLTPVDLPSFSYQITSGMIYLSSIGIVHRDLACRNVLVDADKALKITDFGLSRETEDIYVQKSKGRVPYKWMAIESIIAREFTTASDVWAFGVVLWEIETLGGVPYPGVSNAELLPLLKRGHRMEKPDSCSSEIYNIMLSCWQEDSAQRPTFQVLKSNFNDILASHGSDAYVDFCIDPNQLYYNTEEEPEAPPSINLIHSSTTIDKSKDVSSVRSFEAFALRKTTSAPEDSPRLKRQPNEIVTHYPSVEKFPSDQHPSKDDRRPNSMMLLQHNYEQKKFKVSGIDKDKLDKDEDDRYVRNPSATFDIPNALFGRGAGASQDSCD